MFTRTTNSEYSLSAVGERQSDIAHWIEEKPDRFPQPQNGYLVLPSGRRWSAELVVSKMGSLCGCRTVKFDSWKYIAWEG